MFQFIITRFKTLVSEIRNTHPLVLGLLLLALFALRTLPTFNFDQVLLYANTKDLKIGKPFVEGAKVVGKALEHGKGKKIMVFRYKSKTRYKK